MSAPAVDLKAARLNRGLSLRAAAREIGVHEQSVRRAEAGESVQPAIAFKIATFFDYKVTDIWPVDSSEQSPSHANGKAAA